MRPSIRAAIAQEINPAYHCAAAAKCAQQYKPHDR
jgi:hypothetical protein